MSGVHERMRWRMGGIGTVRWFKRQRETAAPAAVQLRNSTRHPFGMLRDYVPMRTGELQLYREVREAVPLVDAAIYKLVRMCGGVSARCGDPAAERELAEFLRRINRHCKRAAEPHQRERRPLRGVGECGKIRRFCFVKERALEVEHK